MAHKKEAQSVNLLLVRIPRLLIYLGMQSTLNYPARSPIKNSCKWQKWKRGVRLLEEEDSIFLVLWWDRYAHKSLKGSVIFQPVTHLEYFFEWWIFSHHIFLLFPITIALIKGMQKKLLCGLFSFKRFSALFDGICWCFRRVTALYDVQLRNQSKTTTTTTTATHHQHKNSQKAPKKYQI